MLRAAAIHQTGAPRPLQSTGRKLSKLFSVPVEQLMGMAKPAPPPKGRLSLHELAKVREQGTQS